MEVGLAWWVSGDVIDDRSAMSMKLTIGYSSGGVGVSESTVMATVSCDCTALLMTNSDDFEDDSLTCTVVNAVYLSFVEGDSVVTNNLPGPGGYNAVTVAMIEYVNRCCGACGAVHLAFIGVGLVGCLRVVCRLWLFVVSVGLWLCGCGLWRLSWLVR